MVKVGHVAPGTSHPFIDSPSFDVTERQSGEVWFLGAPFGTVECTCSIPSGKALFMPILNFAWISTDPSEPQTANVIRPLVAPPADAVTGMTCTIDGVPVKNLTQYRTESVLFNVALPDKNLFGAPAGVYGPSTRKRPVWTSVFGNSCALNAGAFCVL